MILHEKSETRKHSQAVKHKNTWHFRGSGAPRSINSDNCQSAQGIAGPTALVPFCTRAGKLGDRLSSEAEVDHPAGTGGGGTPPLEKNFGFLWHKLHWLPQINSNSYHLLFCSKHLVLHPQPPLLPSSRNSLTAEEYTDFCILWFCSHLSFIFLKCLFSWENCWLKTEIVRFELETTENLKVKERSTEKLQITEGHTIITLFLGLLTTPWALKGLSNE